ncbi:G5 domain-containing protein [bacterium]|nr:G5 domain-containing protein [bacterium]
MFFLKKKAFARILFALTILLLSAVFLNLLFSDKSDSENRFQNLPDGARKKIGLIDDSLAFEINSSANTVGEFLTEQDINLKENDLILPPKNSRISSGSRIIIQRAKNITIIDNKKEIKACALLRNVEETLWENGIEISADDIVSPERNSLITDKTEIKIIRVEIEEEMARENIDFKKITETDNKMGWQEKKITQRGEKGVQKIKYKVICHNGKEISRKVLETKIIKKSLPEITVKGTYVKLGKSHKGMASWYVAKTLTAANPWLPIGSYVKVTNRANGKSVIVQIADRGPFGNGRIIDLDKTAFQKIASLGQGVVDVKMEEILN